MRRHLLLGFFLLAACAVLFADDRSNLEKQLRQDYEGKLLTLRTFYDGAELRFDASGNKIAGGDPGPWTVDAQVQVEKVRLSGDKLELDGKRLFLVYNEKTQRFDDVATWIEIQSGKFPKKDAYEALRAQQRLHIIFELPAGKLDADTLRAAMQKVFLAPGEYLADFVPACWKPLVRQLYGGSPPAAAPNPGGMGVFRVGGGVVAPHVTYEPDPDYSEPARAARFQGTALLALIVGADGEVRDVRIVKPLGLGLDDRSVAVVQRWKFQPGLKDGKPVAVAIQVEMGFHLY